MSEQPVEILMVEDNLYDEELALHALRNHNLANHIQVVHDGAEALDYVFCTGSYADRSIEDTPKLILLDLKLPKVDGLEVLKRIKSDSRTKSIPIVMLTSSSQERDIIDSYELGVNSYIVKPVDFEQFSQAVQQIGFYWLLLNQSPSI